MDQPLAAPEIITPGSVPSGLLKFLPGWAKSVQAPRVIWFLVELMASITTLAGVYLGSTTLPGVCMYVASLVFWYALTVKKRLWGLMPLNIGTTVVLAINLYKALNPTGL